MVTRMIRRPFHSVIRRLGFTVTRIPVNQSEIFYDMDEGFGPIYRATKDMTTSSIDRMYALYQATRYVSNFKIPGDIVECGVWQGGSSMIAALTLLSCGEQERKLWMYDTYLGQPEPSGADLQANDGSNPHPRWRESQRGEINDWAYVPLEQVRSNILGTGYPANQLVFIKGNVEDTIPHESPEEIAILRLDTDWRSSIAHELQYLYPKLAPGGVLIVDSYGWWTGCREATDRYFAENGTKMLLNRIDNAGRIGVKP